jgi:hypothetical protein
MDAKRLIPDEETARLRLVGALNDLLAARQIPGEARDKSARYLLVIVDEIASVARHRLRGNTTVKVCHPEGELKRAYLNDREI